MKLNINCSIIGMESALHQHSQNYGLNLRYLNHNKYLFNNLNGKQYANLMAWLRGYCYAKNLEINLVTIEDIKITKG